VTTAEQNRCFDEWLTHHRAVLHHVANGFAAGDDRNDLMQELLLAVWRAVPAFRHSAQPATFIYRVAHNAALTWKRTERNYRARVDRFSELSASGLLPRSRDGNSEQEMLEHLYTAIRTFPPLDRSLLLLQLEGLSYSQMAEIHGLSESNVGVRLTRLKQKLTTQMEEISHELR
jgi:RNA polymerase sigma-70 factor (ECF subfamily)